MNMTIVGGGNIGTQFAAHAGAKGHHVTMYSPHAESFSSKLRVVNEGGAIILEGALSCATHNPEEAFSNADLVFVTTPAFMMNSVANEMVAHLREGSAVCLVPGTGGGECAFAPILNKGCAVFGLQRVPSVARLVKYGEVVCASGYRDALFGAALPNSCSDAYSAVISDLFDMPCESLANYLDVTLTPSNPILHTSRLYCLFRDYHDGVTYDHAPLFYGDWDEDSSVLLLQLDEEVQRVCTALSMFDLSGVRSLREHYESSTPEELTQKIRSIQSLHRLSSPMKPVSAGGLVPDLGSRYFTADFPYGLSILVQIAQFAGVPTPGMDLVIHWYRNLAHPKIEFSFSSFGINRLEDFVAFYAR